MREVNFISKLSSEVQDRINECEMQTKQFTSTLIMDSESLKEYCKNYMQGFIDQIAEWNRIDLNNLTKQVTAITESLLIEQGIASQLLRAE